MAAATLAACTKSGPQGRRLASGLAREVIVAPGGRMIAFLQAASHPDDRGVPDDLLVGDLLLASTSDDSPAQRVGGGVPTLAGARAFSPAGEWLAFLAQWRFRAGQGELWLADSSGSARKIADGVSAMSWAPSGSLLAFVAAGRLMVLDAAKEPARPSLALDGVQASTRYAGSASPGSRWSTRERPSAIAASSSRSIRWLAVSPVPRTGRTPTLSRFRPGFSRRRRSSSTAGPG